MCDGLVIIMGIRRSVLRLCPVVALATAVAAVPTPLCAQDVPEDFVVTLERTSCGGLCPVYSVTINARGEVTYQGTMFVRVEGPATDRIPVSRVGALLSTIERIRFFELLDRYLYLRRSDGVDVAVTDLATAFVSVTLDGRTKRVEDYLGSPDGLRELERQIDDAARTQRWIRIDVATLREMVESGRPPPADERQRFLRDALYADDVDVIRALLDLGADANVSPGDEHQGPTRPLVIARSAAAARALVDAGADVSASDEFGQTPLGRAVWLPPDVTEVLLRAGAPVDLPADHVGDTALVRAAAVGNVGVVRLLLSAGANPAFRADGGTALDFARRAQAFESRRDPLLAGLGTMPFVQDFDGVIAALEQALETRRR